MFYIYILYSESADKYYVGHSDDPTRRLDEHNSVIKNSFTAKFRPWILKATYEVSDSRGETRKVENHIKRMKSRITIEKMIGDPEEFRKILMLVRAIPRTRD
jgi:putative endonuclease